MDSLEEIDAALDEEPMDFDIFKGGAVKLTRQEDWEELEAYYRRQLRRTSDLAEDEIKHQLWYQLGQIYELRLDRLESAEQAYMMALSLQPDNEELEARLLGVQERLEE